MYQTDFLIIGSGMAGLNLSLLLAECGEVTIVTKGNFLESNSYRAQGGIAAVSLDTDNVQKHFQDTWKASAHYGNKKAIEYLVKEAPDAIQRLTSLGVIFEKNVTKEGGHSQPRVHHTRDQTGKNVIEVLMKQVKRHKNIQCFPYTVALELIMHTDTCYGAYLYDLQTKKTLTCFAKVVILATGGCGQVYEKTTNPVITTGDGFSIAFKSGLLLKDMEFMQFHPTALDSEDNPLFLLSETLRGEGALLRNSEEKAFMENYHKLKDLAPRDIVSRAIFHEQKNGKVYLDFRHKKRSFLKQRFPHIYETLVKHSLYLEKNLIPITPAAHYICGGIQVDMQGRTNKEHVYALGEIACTGVHGANRLASNSLLETLVFAKPLFLHIQNNLKQFRKSYRKIPQSFSSECPYVPKNRELQNTIKHIMWENVGIIRSTISLQRAEQFLEKCKKPQDIETQNMLITATLITKAAIHRKKSLGCHYRLD